MQLEIRRVEEHEADAVGSLTKAVYLTGGFADDDYAPVLADVRSRMRDAVVLVAAMDSELIGTVTIAAAGSTYAAFAGPGEWEVRMLAVDAGHRRKGVARSLMDAAESLARTSGAVGVVLSTETGMHAAHRLYEARGYVRQPHRDRLLDGSPPIRLLAYRLAL